MGFHPTKTDPCVMLTENLKTNCCEYIAVYVNGQYIATQKPEAIVNTLKTKCKLKVQRDAKLSYHLGADYSNYPGGTMVCQPKK